MFPRATAEKIGLPSTAGHPQDAAHYMGLYFMASRGARLVESVTVPAGINISGPIRKSLEDIKAGKWTKDDMWWLSGDKAAVLSEKSS